MLKKFQIIGYAGGVPTQERGVTCIMVSNLNYDIMIDCGEGTYLLWQKAGFQWETLQYILITHMHPDHIGGLLPFLFYRRLFHIRSNLTLIGPPQLQKYISDSFSHAGITNNHCLHWINISENNNIKLQDTIQLTALKMKHKIPCWGYTLQDIEKKFTFITDTLPNSNAIKLAENSDVLIHEATYPHKYRKKATEHFHTTEIQAMEIADTANVKRLILTHFSQRLSDKEVMKWTWKGQSCVVFDKSQNI